MKRIAIDRLVVASLNLHRFQGFPYLITRVVPGMYHVILLPGDCTTEQLYDIARKQTRANKLDTCLALDNETAFYIGIDGREYLAGFPPCGGGVVTGRLQPCEEFPLTEEYEKRRLSLDEYETYLNQSGYATGDLTKGGRDATPEELGCLQGKARNGTLKGLTQCPVCRQWRGQCLDQNPHNFHRLVTVHCDCDNDNLCARCGNPLASSKLNGNRYSDGEIWHNPGFTAFSHECKGSEE